MRQQVASHHHWIERPCKRGHISSSVIRTAGVFSTSVAGVSKRFVFCEALAEAKSDLLSCSMPPDILALLVAREDVASTIVARSWNALWFDATRGPRLPWWRVNIARRGVMDWRGSGDALGDDGAVLGAERSPGELTELGSSWLAALSRRVAGRFSRISLNDELLSSLLSPQSSSSACSGCVDGSVKE